MIIILLFLAVLMGLLAWWLSRQGLATKPWLETGVGAVPEAAARPAATIGLGVFLGVAGTLLVLLVSAYAMRMQAEDWRPLPLPRLLWLNTALLVLGSLALQRAKLAAEGAADVAVQPWLAAGGIAALAFLVGQLAAWRQLAAAGYRPDTNPADAFFFLITAIHGLHVLGGLVALARTGLALRRDAGAEALRLSVTLCATYWHFLLLVWVVLFALLAATPTFGWFYALCRAPFE